MTAVEGNASVYQVNPVSHYHTHYCLTGIYSNMHSTIPCYLVYVGLHIVF